MEVCDVCKAELKGMNFIRVYDYIGLGMGGEYCSMKCLKKKITSVK